jgi:hypothetical protein
MFFFYVAIAVIILSVPARRVGLRSHAEPVIP